MCYVSDGCLRQSQSTASSSGSDYSSGGGNDGDSDDTMVDGTTTVGSHYDSCLEHEANRIGCLNGGTCYIMLLSDQTTRHASCRSGNHRAYILTCYMYVLWSSPSRLFTTVISLTRYLTLFVKPNLTRQFMLGMLCVAVVTVNIKEYGAKNIE